MAVLRWKLKIVIKLNIQENHYELPISVRYATTAHREIFHINALSGETTPASFTKFAGYLHWEVSFSGTEISLILKTRWLPLAYIYPTALKGCRGIVFTHGVRMGGRQEKVCLGCISKTARCWKLIIGRDIGWGRCRCDLDLTLLQ